MCSRKSPYDFIRVSTRGDSNSRNGPIPGSRISWYATGATGYSIPIAVSGSGHAIFFSEQSKLSSICKKARTRWPKAASRVVLCRMQVALHAPRLTPRDASRLVRAMSAWSAKTRRAPSRHCWDARIYGLETTSMQEMSTPLPPPKSCLSLRYKIVGNKVKVGNVLRRWKGRHHTNFVLTLSLPLAMVHIHLVQILLYPTAIGSEPQDPTLNSSAHWRRVMQGHAAVSSRMYTTYMPHGVYAYGRRMQSVSFVGNRNATLQICACEHIVPYEITEPLYSWCSPQPFPIMNFSSEPAFFLGCRYPTSCGGCRQRLLTALQNKISDFDACCRTIGSCFHVLAKVTIFLARLLCSISSGFHFFSKKYIRGTLRACLGYEAGHRVRLYFFFVKASFRVRSVGKAPYPF